MSGKTIELYIEDTGLKTAEIYENNLKALFGKRNVCKELKKDDRSNCIYILLNDSAENSEKRIYIGKTSEMHARFSAHDRKKDWWTDFIIFTSDKFESTHLDYLEQKLCRIAKANAIDTTLENKQKPKVGASVRQIKKVQSENFFTDITFLLNNLNIVTLITKKDVNTEKTEEKINKKSKPSAKKNLYFIKLSEENGEQKTAMLEVTKDGYSLLKDSYLKLEACPSLKETSSPFKNRKVLIERKLIKQEGNFYKVLKDITYGSSSLPAAVVTGRPSNGRIEWKLEDGRTLADTEKPES